MPTYWQKDDHDYRYNDTDNTGEQTPLPTLGARIFKEQVPTVDPSDPNAVTYRTHRVSQDLQIWLAESRDDRGPNMSEPGPDKTLWGTAQLEWFKQTLAESNATFKILISPTPMVGPDDTEQAGRPPGDPALNDPNAFITQFYTYAEPTGGFLNVTVTPGSLPAAAFRFYDEQGELLYEETKVAQN